MRGEGENASHVGPSVIHPELRSSVDRTLNKNSDSVSGNHLLFWHGLVCLSLCVTACMCVSPAVVIRDEEVSYSTPVQLLATENSHSFDGGEKKDKLEDNAIYAWLLSLFYLVGSITIEYVTV